MPDYLFLRSMPMGYLETMLRLLAII